MKKISKKAKISIISCVSVVAILFVAVMVYYYGASFPGFKAIAKEEFKIPGLETKFTPQGMAYDSQTGKFLISGYFKNQDASRIYVIDKETGKTEKYVTLTTPEGEEYIGHAGGIAVYDNTGWIAGDKTLNRFSLSDLYSAENEGSIDIIDTLETPNGADFVTVYEGNLIIGEFYREKNYPTDQSHHLTTSNGETNRALALAYKINENENHALDSITPIYGISMTDLVQGMAFTSSGNIILSTSYSLPNSKLLVYVNPLNGEPQTSVEIDGHNINVYMLDNSNLNKTIEAPCMSEEIVAVDGRIYVLFENNCSQYRLFTRTRLSNVFSIVI